MKHNKHDDASEAESGNADRRAVLCMSANMWWQTLRRLEDFSKQARQLKETVLHVKDGLATFC